MAVDLYFKAYEDSGLDIIQTSLHILMTGKLSEYGHHNYDNEQLAICLVLAPHLAGLFADLWNMEELPRHEVLNAHEGQLHGNDTAVVIADKILTEVRPSDLEFIIEKTCEERSEAETAFYFSNIVDKIKNDLAAIIKHTAHEKREAMRKLNYNKPVNTIKLNTPKPAEPKPSWYNSDSDAY